MVTNTMMIWWSVLGGRCWGVLQVGQDVERDSLHFLPAIVYYSTGTTMPRMMMFWQNMKITIVGIAAMTRLA